MKTYSIEMTYVRRIVFTTQATDEDHAREQVKYFTPIQGELVEAVAHVTAVKERGGSRA